MANPIRGHQGKRKGIPVPPVEALASDLAKDRFLAALECDAFCDTAAACKKAGIRVSDLPRLLEEDATFRESHDEVQAEYTARLEATAHERATRDSTVLKWLLQARLPKKYGTQSNVSMTVNLTPEQVEAMSIEELEELQRKLQRK